MKKTVLTLCAAALLVTACTTPGKRTAIGGAGGAAVGAAAGAIIAKTTGGKAGQGAAWGAAAGVVLGGALGNYYDKQAKELAAIADVQKKADGNGLVVTLKNDILFDSGNAALSSASANTLNDLLRVLKKYPKNNIVVAGFTDSTGTDAVNNPLSVQRAKAVYDYLLANGLKTKSIQYVGYGSAYPVGDNATAAGRAMNRRVELAITANEKDIQ